MTHSDHLNMRRFCRANKRAHERFLIVVSACGNTANDPIYRECKRAAAKAWEDLPDSLKNSVLKPVEEQ